MIEFVGIDHVQLAAPKGCERKARAFYGELLGWEELTKPYELQKRGGVWFQCGVHQVHIGVDHSFVAAKKAHPAFLVKELNQLKSLLIAHQMEVIDDELRADEGIRRFFIHDPFGNRIEFLERIS